MLQNILKKRVAFGTPLPFSLFLAFLAFYLGAAWRVSPWRMLPLYLISLLLFLYPHVVALFGRETLTRRDKALVVAITVGSFLLAVFLLVGGVRMVRLSDAKGAAVLFSFAAFFFLLAAFEVFFLWRSGVRVGLPAFWRGAFWKENKRAVCHAIPFLLFFLFLTVSALSTFDAWLRWDSFAYVNWINKLKISALLDLRTMRLADHAAYPWCIIYLVAMLVVGDGYLASLWLNALMLLCGTFFFYRILRRMLPHTHRHLLLLGTCLFAFSPIFLGCVYAISLEYCMAFAFLLYLWGEAEDLPFISVLGAIMVCFSKETGAPTLAAMVGVKLAISLFLSWRRKGSFVPALSLSTTLPILGIGLVWLRDINTFNWMMTNSTANGNTAASSAAAESAGAATAPVFNTFGINSVYIHDKLESLFATNFTWLLFGLFALGIVAFLFRRRKDVAAHGVTLFSMSAACLAVSLLIGFVFVTYSHVRYNSVTVMMLSLMLVALLCSVDWHRAVTLALLGLVSLLLLLQCYRTVDPVMLSVLKSADKGHGRICYTQNTVISRDAFGMRFCDSFLYNREILGFDRAFDALLADTYTYDERICYLISGKDYQAEGALNKVSYDYLILGNGYRYFKNPRYITFDPETGRRFLATTPEREMGFRSVATMQHVKQYFNEFDTVYYIEFPMQDTFFDRVIKPQCTYTECETREVEGWQFKLYRITSVPQ